MIFKRVLLECVRCGNRTEEFRWDTEPTTPCTCGGTRQDMGVVSENAPNVIDDQIEGGPRWFETLGHEPVWIESKSQLRREAEVRGKVPCVRHEQDYYRRLFKRHDEELRDIGKNKEY